MVGGDNSLYTDYDLRQIMSEQIGLLHFDITQYRRKFSYLEASNSPITPMDLHNISKMLSLCKQVQQMCFMFLDSKKAKAMEKAVNTVIGEVSNYQSGKEKKVKSGFFKRISDYMGEFYYCCSLSGVYLKTMKKQPKTDDWQLFND